MSEFSTVSPADNLSLKGTVFPAPKDPKIAMALIHGFGEHCDRYANMADHLANAGIATVALDLRGHGRSAGKRGHCASYDLLLSDLSALLTKTEQVYPDLPLFLYGHSMGGGLVLHHALKNGTEGLDGIIASAPLMTVPNPPSGFMRGVIKVLRKLAPNMALKNAIKGDRVSRLKDEQIKYEIDPLNHSQLGIGLAEDIIEGGAWVLSEAKNWTAPLLLMHARADKLTEFSSSESFSKHAQNCQFIAYDDCEHEIHNDATRPDVYRAMVEFMKA